MKLSKAQQEVIDIDTDVDEDSMNAWYGIEETQ